MYLTFIPHEVKMYLVSIMEIVILALAIYFFIRFVLGFFLQRKSKQALSVNSSGKVSELTEEIALLEKITRSKEVELEEVKNKKQ